MRRDEGPEDIGDREDPDEVGDLAALEPVRISRAIEKFVMVQHDIDHFRREPGHGFERLRSEQRMLPDDAFSLSSRVLGFSSTETGNPGLPDVVQ